MDYWETEFRSPIVSCDVSEKTGIESWY